MKSQDALDKMENEEGFFHHNNYHIVEANDKNIIIRADLNNNSMNPYNMAHGGLIFGLGDTVMGMIAAASGKHAVTLNANISYLLPGTGKYLIAKGEIVRSGKTTCVARANIYNDKEKLIAILSSTYYYID